jgi:hypothetical protein
MGKRSVLWIVKPNRPGMPRWTVFRIIFFIKKLCGAEKFQKKMFCGFFSFELFFNTHGQKIWDYKKKLTEISPARNLIQFQGDNIFFLGKIPGNCIRCLLWIVWQIPAHFDLFHIRSRSMTWAQSGPYTGSDWCLTGANGARIGLRFTNSSKEGYFGKRTIL